MVRALLLLACLLLASVAEAATRYVDNAGGSGPGGSDANSCAASATITTAKANLTGAGGALACMVAGDTLLVRGGVYAEAISDDVTPGTSWANKVRIANYNGETVTLRPSSAATTVVRLGDSGATDQYIEFDGIDLDALNVTGNAVYLTTSTTTNHHIRFQNLEVSEYDTHGGCAAFCIGSTNNEFLNITVHGGGKPGAVFPETASYGFYLAADDNLIDGANIYDTTLAGVQIYQGAGAAPDGNIVRNSRIHATRVPTSDNRLFGIIDVGTNSQIYNNLIYNNTDANATSSSNAGLYGFAGASGGLWYNNTVTNNIYRGALLDPFGTPPANVAIKNNIFYQNAAGDTISDGGTGTTTATNLVGTNPQFANVALGNYHLQTTSPAKDAGTNGLVTIDFDGNPRPQNGTTDIGAFEFILTGDLTWPISDTFTDTSGDDLVSQHNGEQGATWGHHAGVVAAQITNANRLRPSTPSVAGFVASGLPPTANYCTQILFRQVTETDDTVGIKSRIAGQDSYYIGYYWGGVAQRLFYLVLALNGAPTILGTYSQTLSDGTDHELKLCHDGPLIWLEVDDVIRIGPVTDTSITAAGQSGIDFSTTSTPSNTTGYHIDTFTTFDIAVTSSRHRLRIRP